MKKISMKILTSLMAVLISATVMSGCGKKYSLPEESKKKRDVNYMSIFDDKDINMDGEEKDYEFEDGAIKFTVSPVIQDCFKIVRNGKNITFYSKYIMKRYPTEEGKEGAIVLELFLDDNYQIQVGMTSIGKVRVDGKVYDVVIGHNIAGQLAMLDEEGAEIAEYNYNYLVYNLIGTFEAVDGGEFKRSPEFYMMKDDAKKNLDENRDKVKEFMKNPNQEKSSTDESTPGDGIYTEERKDKEVKKEPAKDGGEYIIHPSEMIRFKLTKEQKALVDAYNFYNENASLNCLNFYSIENDKNGSFEGEGVLNGIVVVNDFTEIGKSPAWHVLATAEKNGKTFYVVQLPVTDVPLSDTNPDSESYKTYKKAVAAEQEIEKTIEGINGYKINKDKAKMKKITEEMFDKYSNIVK